MKNLRGGCSHEDGSCTIRRLGHTGSAPGGGDDGSFTIRRLGHTGSAPGGGDDDGGGDAAVRTKRLQAAARQRHNARPDAEGFTVYGAEWCGFCRRAKHLLRSLSLPCSFVDVDSLGGAASARHMLGARACARASGIPVVFAPGGGEAAVGGYTELCAHLAAHLPPGVSADQLAEATAAAHDESAHVVSYELEGHSASAVFGEWAAGLSLLPAGYISAG